MPVYFLVTLMLLVIGIAIWPSAGGETTDSTRIKTPEPEWKTEGMAETPDFTYRKAS
jgi:hypothetical protein